MSANPSMPRRWERATGADLTVVLETLGVEVQSPDAPTARAAAELAGESDLSIADRFLLATGRLAGARVWTTDDGVQATARKLRMRVTHV